MLMNLTPEAFQEKKSNQGERKKTWKKALLLFLLAAIVAFILARYIGTEKAIEIISRADKRLIFLAVLIQLLNLVLVSYKLKFLIEKTGEKAGLAKLCLVTMAGNFVNNLTPGARVSGDAFRIYVLNKNLKIRADRAAAGVFAERVFDFAVLVAFFAAGYFYLVQIIEIPERYKEAIKLALLAVAALFIALLKFMKSEKMQKLFLFLPARIGERLELFRTSYAGLIQEKGTSFYALLISIVIWSAEILRAYLVLLSLGVDVAVLKVAVANVTTLFISLVPLTPGGIGVVEGSLLGIYLAIGIQKEIAVMAVIIDRAIAMWLMTLLGAFAATLLTDAAGEH